MKTTRYAIDKYVGRCLEIVSDLPDYMEEIVVKAFEGACEEGKNHGGWYCVLVNTSKPCVGSHTCTPGQRHCSFDIKVGRANLRAEIVAFPSYTSDNLFKISWSIDLTGVELNDIYDMPTPKSYAGKGHNVIHYAIQNTKRTK